MSREPHRSRYADRLSRLLRQRGNRKPPGLPPGAAVSVGAKVSDKTQIELWSYDSTELETIQCRSIEECRAKAVGQRRVLWYHVTGLTDPAAVADFGQALGMHSLMTEDVLNTQGRSKLDTSARDLFLTTRILRLRNQDLFSTSETAQSHQQADGGKDFAVVEAQHLAIFVSPHLVVTFCESPTTVFDPVRRRLQEACGRIRQMDADYLLWAVMDAVVDHYLLIIDAYDERLQALDQRMEDGIDQAELTELYRIRSDIMSFYRVIRPLRDIATVLGVRGESTLLTQASSPFFRDLYDHVVHALDLADDLRDQANALREFAITSANQRMNEIMKMLACVSALFLPLTFLAGVYGMNFEHLPGKEWFWGFDAFVVVCGLIVIGMALFFKRKQWL